MGNLDLGDPDAVAVVNSWAYDHTKGKIDKYIDNFDPNTALFLANALYFKGTWKFEFDSQDTRQADFHTAATETVQVPTMSMRATVPYFTNETFNSIILPYKNDRYEMLVFLPHEDFSTSDIVSELNAENLGNWLDSYTETGLDIQLPKFKTEYKRELN